MGWRQADQPAYPRKWPDFGLDFLLLYDIAGDIGPAFEDFDPCAEYHPSA
jgi:hypothetical protein